MPELETRFHQHYADQGLTVMALNPWSVEVVTEETLEAYVAQTGVTFPVMFDDASPSTYSLYDQVGATAPFPLDVIVDRSGVVRYVSTRYEPDEIEDVIVDLLAE